MTLRIGGRFGGRHPPPKDEPASIHKVRRALTDIELKALVDRPPPECKIDEYGCERWYLAGQLHREDGPAVLHPTEYPRASGDPSVYGFWRRVCEPERRKEYWFEGVQHKDVYSNAQWRKKVRELIIRSIMEG